MKNQARIGYSKYGLCLKFSTEIQVCLQPKGMSLEEATIPWWGALKFGACNPQKITKYGLMV
jgi:hypothetical protein